jgi:hypothetical protein
MNTESIKLPRKNDCVLNFTYQTSASVAVNVSTITAAKFTVVSKLTGLRVLQKTWGSGIAYTGAGTGTDGKITVTLSGTDTALSAGDYDYDLEISYATTLTVTLAVGMFRMIEIYSDYSAT